LKVRLATYHEQSLAGRDVDAQDSKPVTDAFLVNADFVEPEGRFPVVLDLELLFDPVKDGELGLGVVVPAVGDEVVDRLFVGTKLANGGQRDLSVVVVLCVAWVKEDENTCSVSGGKW
jgi:hypothetical protein